MIGTDPGLLNAALIERLVQDAGKIAKYFVGASRDETLIALAEIRDIAEANLNFLPPEIAQLTASAFVTAIASRAAELEDQQGTLQ